MRRCRLNQLLTSLGGVALIYCRSMKIVLNRFFIHTNGCKLFKRTFLFVLERHRTFRSPIQCGRYTSSTFPAVSEMSIRGPAGM